jgi:hypothetical protein
VKPSSPVVAARTARFYDCGRLVERRLSSRGIAAAKLDDAETHG